jgi:hypothetical protein
VAAGAGAGSVFIGGAAGSCVGMASGTGLGAGGATGVSGCLADRFCATVVSAGAVRRMGWEWWVIGTGRAGVRFGWGAGSRAVVTGAGVTGADGITSGLAAGATGTGACAGTALEIGAETAFGR